MTSIIRDDARAETCPRRAVAEADPPIVTYQDPYLSPTFQIWVLNHQPLGLCERCPAQWSPVTHWEKCPASTGRHKWAEPCPYTGDIP